MKKMVEPADIVVYSSIAIGILWYFLKATGIVNTFFWLDSLPMLLGFLVLGILYIKLGRNCGSSGSVEYRKMSLSQAMKEIEKYTRHKKEAFWMEDIIRDLEINPKTVLKAVENLEKEKKIKPVGK
ncbi:hypothetical protein A3K63_05720 [Candidatus Micrarchaeota archaeon RBG_16_49_10]|nr:MAG: hypothetical protein A3K63_05720 [Candidatus Micrarchaeota archaeon RBG_16_49_10]